MGQGIRVALLGLVTGLLAAFLLVRTLESLLFGVQPADPLTFLAVTVVLWITTVAACYLPARRATRVDPIIALRHE
jgi:ABC-type antimicrobial peptide transport system permease subunit